MSNDSQRNPENTLSEIMNENRLWEYLQSLNPETVIPILYEVAHNIKSIDLSAFICVYLRSIILDILFYAALY